MPSPLYIPDEVLLDIRERLASAMPSAVDGFLSASEDEDSMTGHMGAHLKTPTRTVQVRQSEVNGPWRWSLNYTKFRGRGPGATEKLIGADGIFEIHLESFGRVQTKALLFQAKMDWQRDKVLLGQAMLLSTWREAAVFLNYTPTVFEVFSIDSILRSRGVRADAKDALTLLEALSDYFLVCKVGSVDLKYDAVRRLLSWRDSKGIIVATQFSIPSRFRINITAPSYRPGKALDKLILASEIHQHRLAATASELLTPLLTTATPEPKKHLQALSSAYHPDKLDPINTMFTDLANRRMQEFNAAYTELKPKRGDA